MNNLTRTLLLVGGLTTLSNPVLSKTIELVSLQTNNSCRGYEIDKKRGVVKFFIIPDEEYTILQLGNNNEVMKTFKGKNDSNSCIIRVIGFNGKALIKFISSKRKSYYGEIN